MKPYIARRYLPRVIITSAMLVGVLWCFSLSRDGTSVPLIRRGRALVFTNNIVPRCYAWLSDDEMFVLGDVQGSGTPLRPYLHNVRSASMRALPFVSELCVVFGPYFTWSLSSQHRLLVLNCHTESGYVEIVTDVDGSEAHTNRVQNPMGSCFWMANEPCWLTEGKGEKWFLARHRGADVRGLASGFKCGFPVGFTSSSLFLCATNIARRGLREVKLQYWSLVPEPSLVVRKKGLHWELPYLQGENITNWRLCSVAMPSQCWNSQSDDVQVFPVHTDRSSLFRGVLPFIYSGRPLCILRASPGRRSVSGVGLDSERQGRGLGMDEFVTHHSCRYAPL